MQVKLRFLTYKYVVRMSQYYDITVKNYYSTEIYACIGLMIGTLLSDRYEAAVHVYGYYIGHKIHWFWELKTWRVMQETFLSDVCTVTLISGSRPS